MSEMREQTVLDLPKVYFVRMLVFTLVVGIIVAILYPFLQRAFFANAALNSVIIAALLLGVLYSYRMVWRLWPEVNWVNHFRIADPGLEIPYKPVLLAPMATHTDTDMEDVHMAFASAPPDVLPRGKS